MTFLFTDLQGSTALWERQPDAMRVALAEHDRRMRAAIGAHDGYVFSMAGDSFAAAFASASAALAAAVTAQRSLLEPAGPLLLRARMGLHTGTATIRDGDYFGAAVNRAARLMSAAHGGQTLISGTTARAVAGALPDGVQLIPLGVHRLKDLVEPEEIHQVLHPDLETHFPKIQTLEGPGEGLPTQLTSFVGRERELREIRALLTEHRLVTLTGPGGAGKTRLSLQVAADMVGDVPDGIRLVELAALTDTDVFTDEVADRFGAQAVPDTPLLETIIATIGRRRMLLILDNCEHMIAPVATLGHHLLTSCPGLTVLATSRERLGIDGEALYRVPTLEIPPRGVRPEASIGCDAVRLFVERARLAAPTFEVTDANVDDVVSICRRLDGIPLALELAAARIRSMSPGQIAARLDERFRLLTGAARARPERQQTLLAAIEWGHDLLNEQERIAFRRLSSFVSDFSMEAAEHVCLGGPVSAFDVVDLLAALVDKSMVTPVQGHDGGTRYQYLESMREYGLRHLEAAAERPQVELRQVEWYTEYAEALQVRQRSGDLAGALSQLEAEEDNLRGSLRFAIDAGHFLLAGRLVSALGYLWYAAGLHREGIQWCTDLFDLQPDLPDDVRAGALHTYGTLLGSWTRPDLGIQLIAEQVALRRRLGNPARLAAALNNLGNLQYDVGDVAAAEVTLREAIEQFRAAGETPTLALSSLASGHLHAGMNDDAAALYAEALDEAVKVDNVYGVALATSGLGQCAVRSGRHADARTLLEEARAAFEELRVSPGIADADFNLALVERSIGTRADTARHLLLSLTTPGAHWYDDAQFWLLQVTASIIDDLSTAALFLGAASARYDTASVTQPAYVLADLAATRTVVEEQLGTHEFERCCTAGARRNKTEVVQLAVQTLSEVCAAAENGVQP